MKSETINNLKKAKQLLINAADELPKVDEAKHFYNCLSHLNSYIMQLQEEQQKCKYCKEEQQNTNILGKFCSKFCRSEYYGE